MFFAITFLLLSVGCVLAAEAFPIDSIVWTNQLGSNVTFSIEKTNTNTNGQVSGYYTSAVGITGRHPLVGWAVGGRVISWTVKWQDQEHPNFFSVTSWNGYVDREFHSIVANWLLTSFTGAVWNSTLIGEDVFKPII